MSKKSRGRDGSISSFTAPRPTRLMGVTPLGVTYSAQTPISDAVITGSRLPLPSVTPINPTPKTRVAPHGPGTDNLYRPAPFSKKLTICQSRNIRREVLFATGNGGRNGMKTARFNANSKVKCK